MIKPLDADLYKDRLNTMSIYKFLNNHRQKTTMYILKTTLFLFNVLLVLNSMAQICEDIYEKRIDKFEGTTSFRLNGLNHVSFTKYISKTGASRYYISLTNTGYSVEVGEKGVVILLGDGTKISRPEEEIDVEAEPDHYYGNGDFEYSAFFALSRPELDRIIRHGITDFRLYIFDYELPIGHSELVKKGAQCLLMLK